MFVVCLQERVCRLEEEGAGRHPSVAEVISNDPAARPDLSGTVAQLAAWLKESPQPPAEQLLAPLRELLLDAEDADWKQEYRQLKEEFEKYKVRVIAARKKDPYVLPRPTAAANFASDRSRVVNDIIKIRPICFYAKCVQLLARFVSLFSVPSII